MGDALSGVLAERPGDGLGDFAGFLSELHDAQQLLGLRCQHAAVAQPSDGFLDGAHVSSMLREAQR
jgi:hypothetical protein